MTFVLLSRTQDKVFPNVRDCSSCGSPEPCASPSLTDGQKVKRGAGCDYLKPIQVSLPSNQMLAQSFTFAMGGVVVLYTVPYKQAI
jgi:hypothetical protein